MNLILTAIFSLFLIISCPNPELFEYIRSHETNENLSFLKSTGNQENYDTALIISIFLERKELADKLIKNGANINFIEQGQSPLFTAISLKSFEMAKFLIEK